MAIKPQKMAVLKALQTHSEALPLSGLLALLGQGFAERTTRRWLADLVQQGLVEKIGQKRNTLYRAIPANARNVTIFSPQDQQAIAAIHRPLFERLPIAYNSEWLNQYTPNQTRYMSLEIQTKLRAAGQRSKNHEPAGTYARHIYNRFLIDLSYHSSRLEGNTYSLLETQRLLLEGKSAENKLDEERIMLLNHKEALRYLIENAHKINIDKNEICTVHFLLADALVPAPFAGKIRDHGVRISGSTYIPLENPTQIDKQLQLLSQKAAFIQEPFEQSFFLLVHLSYLQAFVDVNKRTSRLCANIPFMRNNLVPLSFNDIEKDDYIAAMLAVYELNDVGPLLTLYQYSYIRTCYLYDATADAVGFDEIRVRYRLQRRQLLTQIISQQMRGVVLDKLISSAIKKIPKEAREAFLEDLNEDLREISPTRIAGLDVTQAQLRAWLNK